MALFEHDGGSKRRNEWLSHQVASGSEQETNIFYRKAKIPEEKARRSVNFAGPDAAINPEKLYVLPMMKACLMSETYSTGSTLNRV